MVDVSVSVTDKSLGPFKAVLDGPSADNDKSLSGYWYPYTNATFP